MVNRIHSVLFVDDDLLILHGLKRSLEDYGDVWMTDFSAYPKEALEKLSIQSYDAIVTDMHMPVMDGIQLLDLVSQKNPEVLRFVLSGNMNESQVMRSTGLAHQMIPKPSDMRHIFDIVERACRLRDMLTDPKMLHIITGIKNLPSVPQLYNRLVKELQSENASSQTVGNIIAQDAAMTAKVLQLVNSAFFGLADNISSPQRAVTFLGLNTIKALVLGIHVFSEYQGLKYSPISIDALWKHSMQVSSLAFSISKNLQLKIQYHENARVSGILHDIGKLVLLQIPEFLQNVQVNRFGLISIESEYQLLNTSHAEMGAYLLGIWGLPNSIVEAITFHHKPGKQISEKADLLTVLHIANGLINMCQFEKDKNYDLYLDIQYLQKLGLLEKLDEWTSFAGEVLNFSDQEQY